MMPAVLRTVTATRYVTPLLARALLEPLVEDERRRGRERSARLRSLAAEP